MKILVVAEAFPYPPVTGDRIRVFNLIKELAKFHEVYLTGFLLKDEDSLYVQEMKKHCREVHTVTARRISKIRHLPGVLKALMTGQPLDAKFVFCRPMKLIIQDVLKRNPIDLVQIEHSFMAEYLRVIPKGYPAKTVLTFHNVGYVQYKRLFQTEKRAAGKLKNLLNWLAMYAWEPRMAGRFDQCLTVSETDRALLVSRNSKLNTSVIPNGVDTRGFPFLPPTRGRNFIFIGKLSYAPNSDAVLYFSEKILPLIHAEMPDATFTVIGANPPPEVAALAKNKNIRIPGFVENVTPWYEQSQVTVVPLRSGGGTRLKILESMALGRPVVSTSLGCEGIDAEPGVHVCLADDAQTFAARCVQLASDPVLWGRMAEKGRALVEEKYSWEKIGEKLRAEYEKLAEVQGGQ